MAETGRSNPEGTRRMFLGAAVIAAVLAIAVTLWPFLTQNQVGTPKGGANPATSPDVTASRGAPAQRAAESTVGKNNPAGKDTNGARVDAIKQSSRALQLDPQQRQHIKDILAHQSDAPRLEKAPFELMIGAAVPNQVMLKGVPPEVTQVMNGYQGDDYLLVGDEMVIVDQQTRRVVAIVPAVG